MRNFWEAPGHEICFFSCSQLVLLPQSGGAAGICRMCWLLNCCFKTWSFILLYSSVLHRLTLGKVLWSWTGAQEFFIPCLEAVEVNCGLQRGQWACPVLTQGWEGNWSFPVLLMILGFSIDPKWIFLGCFGKGFTHQGNTSVSEKF